jgi:hypothetical protein
MAADRTRRLLVTGFVASLFSGCSAAHPPVTTAPPPAPAIPAEVAPPQPSPGHVWVPGHWRWRRRGGYVWEPGHWTVPGAPTRVWVPGHWAPRGAGYVWIDGRWRSR